MTTTACPTCGAADLGREFGERWRCGWCTSACLVRDGQAIPLPDDRRLNPVLTRKKSDPTPRPTGGGKQIADT